MTSTPEPRDDAEGVNRTVESILSDPYAIEWMDEHMADLRRSVERHRFRTVTVWMGVVIGLIAHIGGYLLETTVTGEPLRLAADLLYSLGLATWTGVVVVLLVEIIPEAKERQLRDALDAYEAALKRGAPSARRE